MQTTEIVLGRQKAHQLYRDYLKHREHQSPVDAEVQAAYYAISKGKVVIRALQSILDAGLDEQGRPKLALAPADSKFCHCRMNEDGSVMMAGDEKALWTARRSKSRTVFLMAGSFPRRVRNAGLRSLMPTIPPRIRPARGIENYHVLWEAEWEPVPPRDPMLLRRVGIGDLWVVCGAWDLTEVERAALSTRVHG